MAPPATAPRYRAISDCVPRAFRHDSAVAWSLSSTLRMLMALACMDTGHRAAAGELAALETKGNRPLSLGTLADGSPVHPNRGYRFADVPKIISGLRFTAHEHKAPAAVSCKAASAGRAYICLALETSVEQLGLDPAAWRQVGSIGVLAAGKKYPFGVYEAELSEGQTFALPAKDRWGAMLISREIRGPTEFVAVDADAGRAEDVPPDEFSQLQQQIGQRRAGDEAWQRAQSTLAAQVVRPDALLMESDRDPLDVVLRRTGALLADLRSDRRATDLDQEAMQLRSLKQRADGTPTDDATARRALFDAACKLRRIIAFKNPLLDFDRIVFLKHEKQARGPRHMVDQYLGFNQLRGGGVYILERPFSDRPSIRSALADKSVENGRLEGRVLEGAGSFLSLELDYDGRSILFAFTEAESGVPEGASFEGQYCTAEELIKSGEKHYYWRPSSTFHIFRAGIDGGALEQLTDGPYNDYDPVFLPSGRIAFISERDCGQCRCGARPLPAAVLHAMMPDGSDVIRLSWHDTNEWHPSVGNDGRLMYTRWDYVDRDSDVAHHLWTCFPDGRDPRAPHGNYPVRREFRPWMEMSLRAIPNSNRCVATAAPHHGEAYGSLVLLDVRSADDRAGAQVRRLTPEVPFPESESAPGVPHPKGKHSPRAEVYGTPWPLSEDYFLCVHDAGQRNYGIYLIDSFGNRELLYRDPAISCLDPIPLRPRRRPPIIPVATTQAVADRKPNTTPADLAMGTVAVMNVYESDQPWPQDVKIKELRIVNIFPKDTYKSDLPNMGRAAQALGRGVLGTVPIEADGSAHFRMPAGTPVYFQLLDERGVAVQTMRSDTYVHPGETLTCVGCHEKKTASSSPGIKRQPIAMRRAPSKIRPEVAGSYPLTFPRLVQPVLDSRCVSCHDRHPGKAPGLHGDRFERSGWSEAFAALQKYGWGMSGGNGAALKEPQYSMPGHIGARASKLWQMLSEGHHEVVLAPQELRAITLWLDCNSNFYAAYSAVERQGRGEIVQPLRGLPPWVDFASLVR